MNVAFALLFVFVPLLVVRLAWPSCRRDLAEWTKEIVGPLVRPAQQVSLSTLQRRIVRAALRGVTVTAAGRAVLPPCRVLLAPADAGRITVLAHVLTEELAERLSLLARKQGWEVADGFAVELASSEFVEEGRPEVHHDLRPVLGGPGIPARSATPAAPSVRTPGTSRTAPAGLPGQVLRTACRTAPLTLTELIPLSHPGPEVDLTNRLEPLLVGREPDADVHLHHPEVSRRHARLTPVGDQWVISDDESVNGTYVNGSRISVCALVHNDEVGFGPTGPRYVYSRLDAADPDIR